MDNADSASRVRVPGSPHSGSRAQVVARALPCTSPEGPEGSGSACPAYRAHLPSIAPRTRRSLRLERLNIHFRRTAFRKGHSLCPVLAILNISAAQDGIPSKSTTVVRPLSTAKYYPPFARRSYSRTFPLSGCARPFNRVPSMHTLSDYLLIQRAIF